MPESETSERILTAVLVSLSSDGYDGVRMQEVARTARVSLATVYKLFPTRDTVIVAAVRRWMTETSYADLAAPPADESLRDGLIRLFRQVFQPWERNPAMLDAYHRARTGAGGRELDELGLDAMLPAAGAVLAGADPEYLDDIGRILTSLSHGLISHYVDGVLPITDILPTLERAVYRLTADNAAAAAAAHTRRQAMTDVNASEPG